MQLDKFAIPYFYIWFKNKLYYHLFWKYYIFLIFFPNNKKKCFILRLNCLKSVLINPAALNKNNYMIVKLKCSKVLKRKCNKGFFHSFCPSTIKELNNKTPLWVVVIIGNSHFLVSLKPISNRDISAAHFSAVNIFCLKSIRPKMHVHFRFIFFKISYCLFSWFLFKRKWILNVLMRNLSYKECAQMCF